MDGSTSTETKLEGAADTLPEAAARFAIDPAHAAHGSYPDLWREHRDRHPELWLPEDTVLPR